MSENEIKIVSSVPSNLANGQPTSKTVPDRVGPKIAPEKIKSDADTNNNAVDPITNISKIIKIIAALATQRISKDPTN